MRTFLIRPQKGLFVYAELDYRIISDYHPTGVLRHIIFICTYNLLSVWKQILLFFAFLRAVQHANVMDFVELAHKKSYYIRML